jgi:cobalamin biosynthetic protein CobC
MTPTRRDHGGGIDAARQRYGGQRADWIDLSTGINPRPYPIASLPPACWTALPDQGAQARLEQAARRFWQVPEGLDLVAAPGTSALILRLPEMMPPGRVRIRRRTYNEHAAAFARAGWEVSPDAGADARVAVHPDNPTGDLWPADIAEGRPKLLVIDESFCDVMPEASHIAAAGSGVVLLKSFGKFWGLAGLRLGFAIGPRDLIAPLREALGPWPVSGPALEIGARALADDTWTRETRARLAQDAERLDALMRPWCDAPRGTSLFRLYETSQAQALHEKLAQARIWSRVFPYEPRWIRLGLPGRAEDWDRLQAALGAA